MKPLICIPMGDPAGIGAEIIIKSLCNHDFSRHCRIVVVGDAAWLNHEARACRKKIQIRPFRPSSPMEHQPGMIDICNSPLEQPEQIRPGVVSAAAGKASMQFIEQSVVLAQNQRLTALATTPVNKESLRAAGIPYIGHTEILSALTGSPDPLTLFQVQNLRVFFVTRHLSLRDACDAITESRVYRTIFQANVALQDLGVQTPHLAVAGLNPHCGEDGLFGDEEGRAIKPAVLRARGDNINVSGPYPADSVFHQALNGMFDGVLSLYHDQGHIATKMVDFERTISITCRLPFLRTSVDHGTAYDIAGKNQASEVSMTEAILLAARYAVQLSQRPEKRVPPFNSTRCCTH